MFYSNFSGHRIGNTKRTLFREYQVSCGDDRVSAAYGGVAHTSMPYKNRGVRFGHPLNALDDS